MTEAAPDFVVVGAGSAGCVLADRLSAGGRRTVLVLEAGGSTTHPAVYVPALIQKLPSSYNWLYPVRPDASREGIADPYSAGRGLGGSSVVNAMLWARGHPADYDGWADAGAEGWDYASVLPYFARAESFEDGDAPGRGARGRVRVGRTRVANPLIHRFIDAAVEAGFAPVHDYNAGDGVGASIVQVNQVRGLRHSMATAYLRPARRRHTVRVVTGAFVTRVLVDGKRVVGVEYRRDGRLYRVPCRREVIVAAGAIGSPALLQRSGIGPADVLARLGIPTLSDLHGVGANLQEHPATSLVYDVTERTLNQEVTPGRVARHAADFLLRGRGVLTTTASHAVAFGRPASPGAAPDVQLVFMAFGLSGAGDEDRVTGTRSRMARLTARSGGREEGRRQVASDPLVTVTAVWLHPRGRGRVVIESADAQQPPAIDQELLGHPADLAGLGRAARAAREVFDAPAWSGGRATERIPGPDVTTEPEWDRHLRGATFRLFHPAGTCAMAGPEAVVDPRLRVLGVESLRVADASVMPTLPSANTQAPTVMIAEKAADLILADAGDRT